jgi:hypothetical protein
MTTTTNTPTPTGLDLVIERLRALTAELQQQQAAAAAEPAAPLPVVLTAPEPEQEELDQTELANALIQDVNEAVAPEVARLIRERVSLWLHRNQLEFYPPKWAGAVRGDLTGMVLELTALGEFTRAEPKAHQWKHREPGAQGGGHHFRLT